MFEQAIAPGYGVRMPKTLVLRALSVAVTLLMVACSGGNSGGTGGGSASGGGTASTGGGTASTGGGTASTGGGTAGTGGGTAGTGGGTASTGGGTASTGGGTASTGGGTSGTGGGSGSADTVCTNEATALCTKLNTCFPAFIQLGYGDVATCTARSKLSCLATFSLNGTGFTADTVTACINAETAANCDQVISNVQPAQCDIRGTLANGAACGDNAQCTTGFCNISSGSCGVCAARVTAGGSCTNGSACASGLVCGGGTCKTAGSAGDVCDSSNPCGGGLYCNAVNVMSSGTCAALVTTAGGACPTASACSFFDGLDCNANMVCSTIPFAQAGAACGIVTGTTYTFCPGGTYCKITTGMASGTCANDAADGATCDASTSCLPNATCTNSLCTLPDPGACM